MPGQASATRRRVPVLLLSFLVVLVGSACASGIWRAALGAPVIHVFDYSDETGTFKEMECPEKGLRFDMVQSRFEAWKRRGDRPDAVLHRTFEEESEGLLGIAGRFEPGHPRWALPYRASVDGN